MKIKIALHRDISSEAHQIGFENDVEGKKVLVLLNTNAILTGEVNLKYCEYELPMDIFRKALAIAVELQEKAKENG